jgi:sugar lactone lactonase YvrE
MKLRFAFAAAFTLIAFAQTPVQPVNDLPNLYRTSRDWGKPPDNAPWAAVTGTEPGPGGVMYIVHRCNENSCANRPEPPILKFDASGKLLTSWGKGMFTFPHGATVDRDGNLWVTDSQAHQVFKFDPNGKVLMTLGTAKTPSAAPGQFDEPTDVLVAPNGNIFITEGHSGGTPGNHRVSIFDKGGKFLKSFGKLGKGNGELDAPHTIAMDSRGRLFVGDRNNNRIVIFDQEGRYIDQWKQFSRPSGITILADDTIFVADSESFGPDNPGWKKGIRIGSAKDGKVVSFIEDSESTAIEHSGAEGVGVDAQGRVFGAVVRRKMLEVHTKK